MDKIDLGEEFSWVDQSDEEFRRVLNSLLYTTDDMFVCGAAGTGKSVLVQIAYKMLKGETLVAASTGISAASLQDAGIPSATLHCSLEIPSHDYFDYRTKIDKDIVNKLKHVDTLIIDEVSMVSCTLLDQVQRVIYRATHGTTHSIRIVMFGDVLQLPPVVRDDRQDVVNFYRDNYDGHCFFFYSNTWNKYRRFTTYHLYKIFRQKDDSFQNILNRIRLNVQSEEDLRIFDSRVIDLEDYLKNNRLCLILASTNRVVDEINEKYGIPKKDGKTPRFRDFYARITGDYDVLQNSDTVRTHERIYVGQQVMCTRNRPKEGFMNGTLGIAEEVGSDYVVITKADGARIQVGRVDWVQSKLDYDEEKKKISYKTVGKFNQIACRAAKAVTIHKSQGMTLDHVYLYMEGSGWIPDSGIYLALSRCRTFDGIGISRPLNSSMIHVDNEALEFLIEQEEKKNDHRVRV